MRGFSRWGGYKKLNDRKEKLLLCVQTLQQGILVDFLLFFELYQPLLYALTNHGNGIIWFCNRSCVSRDKVIWIIIIVHLHSWTSSQLFIILWSQSYYHVCKRPETAQSVMVTKYWIGFMIINTKWRVKLIKLRWHSIICSISYNSQPGLAFSHLMHLADVFVCGIMCVCAETILTFVFVWVN